MLHVKNGIGLYLIISSVVFVMPGAALAQHSGGQGGFGGGGATGGQRPPKPSVSDLVSKMQKTLNLTDEQVGKVRTILENQMNQMESLMQSGDQQSGRTQMESIRKETDSKLADILTPDQLAQWKKLVSQRPQGGGSFQPSQGSGEAGKGESGFEGAPGPKDGSGVY